MKIKVSEASGPALDWMVAKCEGVKVEKIMGLSLWSSANWHRYSTDWAQGGPILQNHIGALEDFADEGWTACCMGHSVDGNTPLEAVCRAYVASKLGDEVGVPDELIDDEPQPCPTCGEDGGTSCGAIDCDY